MNLLRLTRKTSTRSQLYKELRNCDKLSVLRTEEIVLPKKEHTSGFSLKKKKKTLKTYIQVTIHKVQFVIRTI